MDILSNPQNIVNGGGLILAFYLAKLVRQFMLNDMKHLHQDLKDGFEKLDQRLGDLTDVLKENAELRERTTKRTKRN